MVVLSLPQIPTTSHSLSAITPYLGGAASICKGGTSSSGKLIGSDVPCFHPSMERLAMGKVQQYRMRGGNVCQEAGIIAHIEYEEHMHIT